MTIGGPRRIVIQFKENTSCDPETLNRKVNEADVTLCPVVIRYPSGQIRIEVD